MSNAELIYCLRKLNSPFAQKLVDNIKVDRRYHHEQLETDVVIVGSGPIG